MAITYFADEAEVTLHQATDGHVSGARVLNTDGSAEYHRFTRAGGSSVARTAPASYHMDIRNWEPITHSGTPEAARKLRQIIDQFPDCDINYVDVAASLGLMVRAAWNWPNDLPHHDCSMEIYWQGSIGYDTYLRTPNGWVPR